MPQSSIDPIVVKNLRTALEMRGRSAYSVANALGHPPNWLYQVLQGKYGLLIPSLREIARELEIPVGFLVDPREDTPETENQASPNASITGERLAAARKNSGKTQRELAIILGDSYDQQMISELERGRGNLSLEQAALAAKEIGVSLDYLAGLTDEPMPSSSTKHQSFRHP